MKARDLIPITLVAQVGATLAVTLIGCLLIGLWVDSTFGCKPWGIVGFMLLGVASSSYGVYKQVAAAIAAVQAQYPKRAKPSGPGRSEGDPANGNEDERESGGREVDQP